MKRVKVIFEDDFLVVVDKPARLICNRVDSCDEETLQDWFERRYRYQVRRHLSDEVFKQRLGLVHRLDKETSGVLVLAKDANTLHRLMEQFRSRVVQKEYLALVHGKVEPVNGVFRLPLARLGSGKGRFGVAPGGKLSLTEYQVLAIKRVDKEYLSLIKLSPKTGRTHQIRIVMKHLNHPLYADKLYLGKRRYKKDRQNCPRHFLHASRLCLVHPISKKNMCFKAELADELSLTMHKLGFD